MFREEVLRHEVPVDDVSVFLDVVSAHITEIDVIGVLPYVNC